MASKSQSVPFSSLHVTFAKAKNIDTTKAGKLNRSFIRSNFEEIVKVWPELKVMGKNNRDGNRYPPTIPTTVANAIVARDLSKLAKPRKVRAPKVTAVIASEPSAEVTP